MQCGVSCPELQQPQLPFRCFSSALQALCDCVADILDRREPADDPELVLSEMFRRAHAATSQCQGNRPAHARSSFSRASNGITASELADRVGRGDVVPALVKLGAHSGLHVYTGGPFRFSRAEEARNPESDGISRLPVLLIGTGRAVNLNSGELTPVFVADAGLGEHWGAGGLLAIDATSSDTLEVLDLNPLGTSFTT